MNHELLIAAAKKRAAAGGAGPLSISTLFAQGEQGAWYDPGDISTLFQDFGGNTPVTAAGQIVVRMNDKSGNGNTLFSQNIEWGGIYRVDASGKGYLEFRLGNSVSSQNMNCASFAGSGDHLTLFTALSTPLSYYSPGTPGLCCGTWGYGGDPNTWRIFAHEAPRAPLQIYDSAGSAVQILPSLDMSGSVKNVRSFVVNRAVGANQFPIHRKNKVTDDGTPSGTINSASSNATRRFNVGEHYSGSLRASMDLYGLVVRYAATDLATVTGIEETLNQHIGAW